MIVPKFDTAEFSIKEWEHFEVNQKINEIVNYSVVFMFLQEDIKKYFYVF